MEYCRHSLVPVAALGRCARSAAATLTITAMACGSTITFESKDPLVFTAPPPPAPPETPKALAPAPTPEFAIGERIQFSFDSAKLIGDALAQLASVTSTLKKNPKLMVQVEGHASEEGTDEYNQLLSEARAKAVRAFLVAKGIGGSRLSAKGFGESSPLGDNATEEGRERNRRVEFKITSGAPEANGETAQ